MTPYSIRRATPGDAAIIVHQRRAMFEDIGTGRSLDEMERSFAAWLPSRLDSTYFHWIAESDGAPVAGAGILLLDWPPSPRDPRGRLGYVYNVYVVPAHRGRGVARAVMDTLHGWARERGLGALALHASDAGRPLYETLGYLPTGEMRLDLAVREPRAP